MEANAIEPFALTVTWKVAGRRAPGSARGGPARQSPVDKRNVATWRAARAEILQDRGDLPKALQDINFAIQWGTAPRTVVERGVAIDRARRACILAAMGQAAAARRDINLAIAWFEMHLPDDTKPLHRLYEIRDAIHEE